MHNLWYPSASIGDGARLKWQRMMATVYAHLEIILRNYTNIDYALALLAWVRGLCFIFHNTVPSHGL